MGLSAGSLDLHDATLLAITVDWPERSALIEFHHGGRWIVRVSAVRISGIVAPRAEPWGPSKSVLNARVELVDEDDTARLVVEMQSGDVVVVDADRFDMKVDETP